MKISIIIPCYNHAAFLPDAIESALAQDYPDVEVIVVNDGSTDNSSEVARRYPVRLIEQENKGLSAARNTGIRAATGTWILPLDSDDKIEPVTVSRFMEHTSTADIICSYLRTFGHTSAFHNLIFPKFGCCNYLLPLFLSCFPYSLPKHIKK